MINFEILVRFTICLACPLITGRHGGGLSILDNLFVACSEIASVRFRYPFKAEEQLLPQTIEYVGDNHVLYASDVPHWDGEFPKNIKYLWNHPDLSRTTKEKIAYHNGKKYFQLDRKSSAPVARKAN